MFYLFYKLKSIKKKKTAENSPPKANEPRKHSNGYLPSNKPTSSLPDHLMTRSKSENQIKPNRVFNKKFQKNSTEDSNDDDDEYDEDEGGDESDSDIISYKNSNSRSKSSMFRKSNEGKQTKRISFKGTFRFF